MTICWLQHFAQRHSHNVLPLHILIVLCRALGNDLEPTHHRTHLCDRYALVNRDGNPVVMLLWRQLDRMTAMSEIRPTPGQFNFFRNSPTPENEFQAAPRTHVNRTTRDCVRVLRLRWCRTSNLRNAHPKLSHPHTHTRTRSSLSLPNSTAPTKRSNNVILETARVMTTERKTL